MLMNKSLLDKEKLAIDIFADNACTAAKEKVFNSKISYLRKFRDVVAATAEPNAEELSIFFTEIISLGVQQKMLAELFNVTTGTLSRWVSGKQPPSKFIRPPAGRLLVEIASYVIDRMESNAPRREAEISSDARPVERQTVRARGAPTNG